MSGGRNLNVNIAVDRVRVIMGRQNRNRDRLIVQPYTVDVISIIINK